MKVVVTKRYILKEFWKLASDVLKICSSSSKDEVSWQIKSTNQINLEI